jgi:hypothetical protein
MIPPQTTWCGEDWNPLAEPETHRNVTDKNAQAWKQERMLFFLSSTTHMWWPQIYWHSLFLNESTKTIWLQAARHAPSMSTIFCVLCTKFACMKYQTVLVLNNLVMEMFLPWHLRFPFSYASRTDQIYYCARDSRPNLKWCKLAAVFIIPVINKISAFIFIFSTFCWLQLFMPDVD